MRPFEVAETRTRESGGTSPSPFESSLSRFRDGPAPPPARPAARPCRDDSTQSRISFSFCGRYSSQHHSGISAGLTLTISGPLALASLVDAADVSAEDGVGRTSFFTPLPI